MLFEGVTVGWISPRSWKAKAEWGRSRSSRRGYQERSQLSVVVDGGNRVPVPSATLLPYMNDGHDSGNG